VRSPAIFGSIVLHVVVGLVLGYLARHPREQALTPIEVTRGETEPQKRAPEPRKPPPRPSVGAIAPPRAHTPAVQGPPRPSAEPPRPTTEAPEGPAPVETGLQLGNQTGDGIALPSGGPRPTGAPPKPAPPPQRRAPIAQPVRQNDAPCTEEPSKPVPLAKTTPIEYTPRAQADGVEGRLELDITVAADGSVERVQVVEPVEPALDAAAVAAVKTWRFRPSSRCGKPVGGGVYSLARRFELGD